MRGAGAFIGGRIVGGLDQFAHDAMSRILINDGKMKFSNATAAGGLVEAGLVIQGVGDVSQDGSLDLIGLEHGRTVEDGMLEMLEENQ